MNNKDYITLYSTFAKLCYFQHNMAYSAYWSMYCCLELFAIIIIICERLDAVPPPVF